MEDTRVEEGGVEENEIYMGEGDSEIEWGDHFEDCE